MFVRQPAVAGAFYPGQAEDLRQMLAGFLEQANPPVIQGRLRALIVPHAGYIYSGPVAAFGFKLLPPHIKKIILLGPAHTVVFTGAALSTADVWKTPLGRVPLWRPKKIAAPFFDFDLAHQEEHCLEVQLPFLQYLYDQKGQEVPSILPLIISEIDPEVVSRQLEDWLDKETLLIISSDLSHYHSYQSAIEKDHFTIQAILQKQSTVLETQGEACGMLPILAALYLAQRRKWQTQLLDYRNSGDTAGDKSRVVGYAAVALYVK